MNERVTHNCGGVILLRLLKPLDYFKEKYGSWVWGLNKLNILTNKLYHRGHDACGIAGLKINIDRGTRSFWRQRKMGPKAISNIFSNISQRISEAQAQNVEKFNDIRWCKENITYASNIYLSYLTYGDNLRGLEYVQPRVKQSNYKVKNNMIAGNYGIVNLDELETFLLDKGFFFQSNDTLSIILKIFDYYTDIEYNNQYNQSKLQSLQESEIANLVSNSFNIEKILADVQNKIEGGYLFAGFYGNGDSFVTRDPNGIRTGYFYHDEDFFVAASERSAIQSAFNISINRIKEVEPGAIITINKAGTIRKTKFNHSNGSNSCIFERLYFSRSSDPAIYFERKTLGKIMVPEVLKRIEYNINDTVFSYVPNTARTAFYGLLEEIQDTFSKSKQQEIKLEKEFSSLPKQRLRVENLLSKDSIFRNFYSNHEIYSDIDKHFYDVPYNLIDEKIDNIVIIDDCIVRGKTLRSSIFPQLLHLKPKKLLLLSYSPQIRYPDFYGIPISHLKDLIVFQAAIKLLKESGHYSIIDELYTEIQKYKDSSQIYKKNYVKYIYEPFSYQQISNKVCELLNPDDNETEIEILYQPISNLHKACPQHSGDWYFTGDYPTESANMLINKQFINYVENNYNERTVKSPLKTSHSIKVKKNSTILSPIEVYISYSRQQNTLTDQIEANLTSSGIIVIRDTNSVLYKGNIEKFTKKLSSSNKIILLLSQDYFESIYCMHELLLAFNSENFEEKIYPITITPPKSLFNYKNKLKYFNYWNEKQNEILTDLEKMKIDNLASMTGIIEELALIKKISSNIDSIITQISKLNILTFSEMKNSNFEELLLTLNN